MEAKKIWIFGVPRSGTSWFGQIFNSSPRVKFCFQPLFAYAFKDRLTEKSTLKDMQLLYRELLKTEDDFILQKEKIEKGHYPDFQKDIIPDFLVMKEVRYINIVENLLEKDPDVKVIGIVRSPLEVMASWKKAPKEFNPEWSFEKEWEKAQSKNLGEKEEFYGYNKWKEAVLLFKKLKKQYPDNFYLVYYKDLKEECETQVKKIFEFCELPFQEQTKNFIFKSTNSHQDDPYSVYKKSTGNWENELPQKIINEIKEDCEKSGLVDLI